MVGHDFSAGESVLLYRAGGGRARDPANPGGRSVQPNVETHHLSSEELAAYLEGLVTPAERERIEAHLVQCDRCLDEVLSALRHFRPKRPGRG